MTARFTWEEVCGEVEKFAAGLVLGDGEDDHSSNSSQPAGLRDAASSEDEAALPESSSAPLDSPGILLLSFLICILSCCFKDATNCLRVHKRPASWLAQDVARQS